MEKNSEKKVSEKKVFLGFTKSEGRGVFKNTHTPHGASKGRFVQKMQKVKIISS
jgi:hypothetical protein